MTRSTTKAIAEALFERRPLCLVGSSQQQWRTLKGAETYMRTM